MRISSSHNHTLVLTPWQDQLLEELSNARHEVLIASPFIKENIAAKVRAALQGKDISVKTLSRFKERDFAAGASDIDAVWTLSSFSEDGRFEVQYDNLLHAKMYIIDGEVGYVGSSNLTFSGLLRNIEACVRSTDSGFVERLCVKFHEFWSSSSTLSKDDFMNMVNRLGRPKVPTPREDEHAYETKQALNLFETSEGEAWLEAKTAIAPMAVRTVTRATTLARIAEPGAPVSPPDELVPPPDKEVEYDPLPAFREDARKHDERIGSFFQVIQNRFGIDPSKARETYAKVVFRSGATGGFDWPEDGPEPYLPINVDLYDVWGRSTVSLTALGKCAFGIGCFVVARNVGILSRYGPSAVAYMFAACERLNVLGSHWDTNFLGPLITLHGDSFVSASMLTDAAGRLLGAISLSEGLEKTLSIIEEFFNPIDVLGPDILSVIGYKDPKTTLQEITHAVSSNVPSYVGHNSEGPPHDLTWTCEVIVGRTVRVGGVGRTKGEAEMAAAEAALAEMHSRKGWKDAIDARFEHELERLKSDARKTTLRRILTDAERPEVEEAYSRRGLVIDADYGYAAMIDPDIRDRRRLSCDNRSLAHLGSYFIDYLLTRASVLMYPEEMTVFVDRARPMLAKLLQVDDIRANLAFPNFVSDSSRLDAAQSVVAALAITNGFDKAQDMLSEGIKGICKRAYSQSELHFYSPKLTPFDKVEQLDSNFDPNSQYTTLLQEITQELQESASDVSYTAQGPVHDRTFIAKVTFREFIGKGGGKKKRQARNAGSFALLMQMREAGFIAEIKAAHSAEAESQVRRASAAQEIADRQARKIKGSENNAIDRKIDDADNR